jgi:hypothetical protein
MSRLGAAETFRGLQVTTITAGGLILAGLASEIPRILRQRAGRQPQLVNRVNRHECENSDGQVSFEFVGRSRFA